MRSRVPPTQNQANVPARRVRAARRSVTGGRLMRACALQLGNLRNWRLHRLKLRLGSDLAPLSHGAVRCSTATDQPHVGERPVLRCSWDGLT